jgi:hypothetical protein
MKILFLILLAYTPTVLTAQKNIDCNVLKDILLDAPHQFKKIKGKPQANPTKPSATHSTFRNLKSKWNVKLKNAKGIIYFEEMNNTHADYFDAIASNSIAYEPQNLFYEEKIGLANDYYTIKQQIENCLISKNEQPIIDSFFASSKSIINTNYNTEVLKLQNSAGEFRSGTMYITSKGVRVFLVYYKSNDLYLLVDYKKPRPLTKSNPTKYKELRKGFLPNTEFKNNFNTIINELTATVGKDTIEKRSGIFSKFFKNGYGVSIFNLQKGLTSIQNKEEIIFDKYDKYATYSMQFFSTDSMRFNAITKQYDEILNALEWSKINHPEGIVYASDKARIFIRKVYLKDSDSTFDSTVEITPVKQQIICDCKNDEFCWDDINEELRLAIDDMRKRANDLKNGTYYSLEYDYNNTSKITQDKIRVYPVLSGFTGINELTTIKESVNEITYNVLSPSLGIGYENFKQLLDNCMESIAPDLKLSKTNTINTILYTNTDATLKLELVKQNNIVWYFNIIKTK